MMCSQASVHTSFSPIGKTDKNLKDLQLRVSVNQTEVWHKLKITLIHSHQNGGGVTKAQFAVS